MDLWKVFFGKIKNEMFYGYEHEFKTLNELKHQWRSILTITTKKEFKLNKKAELLVKLEALP